MLVKNRKVIVMGRPGVGKTALVNRLVGIGAGDGSALPSSSTFTDAYLPTLETTNRTEVTVRGQRYQLDVIDTSGQSQDDLSAVPLAHSMNVDGYVLVYSVVEPESFDAVEGIHRRLAAATGRKNIPAVIVGNMVDLVGPTSAADPDVVDRERGRQLAARLHASHVETSAKDDSNVALVLDLLLRDVQLAEGDLTPPTKTRKSWKKTKRTLWKSLSCVSGRT